MVILGGRGVVVVIVMMPLWSSAWSSVIEVMVVMVFSSHDVCHVHLGGAVVVVVVVIIVVGRRLEECDGDGLNHRTCRSSTRQYSTLLGLILKRFGNALSI